MLPKKNRLQRAEIKSLLEKGSRIPSPFFLAFYQNNEPWGAALVIAKKILKTSVGRHRLKSQIMGIIEREGLIPGQIVILLSKKALGAGREELKVEYKKLKEKIEKMLQ